MNAEEEYNKFYACPSESDAIKALYDGECPDCGQDIQDDVSNGDECSNCGHVFYSIVEEN